MQENAGVSRNCFNTRRGQRALHSQDLKAGLGEDIPRKIKRNGYDAIVVGLGGHGSATLYHLAKRGLNVLGIEKHGLVHPNGSSHGESRITRIAYHEHPDYVPLLRRAWANWKALERESGQFLLADTGCIQTSDPDYGNRNNTFQNALRSVREYDEPHEVLTGDEVNERFPGYQLPSNYQAVLAKGGVLASERCIAAHVHEAQRHGAEVHLWEGVQAWHSDGENAVVTTDMGRYKAKKIVFAAGAWMPHLIPELQAVLTVERNVIGWFEILEKGKFDKKNFPVCVAEDDIGHFYSFPNFEQPGMKIGKFDHLREEISTPEDLDKGIHQEDEEALREGVAKWFPGANGRLLKAAACMFTNSVDRHFIVDVHPAYANVIICSPCSGHGYKFCSVIGEIASDLVHSNSTHLPTALISIRPDRPGFADLIQSFKDNAGAKRHASKL